MSGLTWYMMGGESVMDGFNQHVIVHEKRRYFFRSFSIFKISDSLSPAMALPLFQSTTCMTQHGLGQQAITEARKQHRVKKMAMH
jgi:hypothetical protein